VRERDGHVSGESTIGREPGLAGETAGKSRGFRREQAVGLLGEQRSLRR
jgi:hypothetical protein